MRLLYYLRQEVIGDASDLALSGAIHTEIQIPTPFAEGDPPTFWWDGDADKCLLVGIYKHGMYCDTLILILILLL